jgi:hypothetical protein
MRKLPRSLAKRAAKITESSVEILGWVRPSFFIGPKEKPFPFLGTVPSIELEEAADQIFRNLAGLFHVAEA